MAARSAMPDAGCGSAVAGGTDADAARSDRTDSGSSDGRGRSRRGVLKGLTTAAAAAVVPATTAYADHDSAAPVVVRLAGEDQPLSTWDAQAEFRKSVETYEDVGNDPGNEAFKAAFEDFGGGRQRTADQDPVVGYLHVVHPDGGHQTTVARAPADQMAEERADLLKEGRGLAAHLGTELRVSTPHEETVVDAGAIEPTTEEKLMGRRERPLGGFPDPNWDPSPPEAVSHIRFTAGGRKGRAQNMLVLGGFMPDVQAPTSSYEETGETTTFGLVAMQNVVAQPRDGYDVHDAFNATFFGSAGEDGERANKNQFMVEYYPAQLWTGPDVQQWSIDVRLPPTRDPTSGKKISAEAEFAIPMGALRDKSSPGDNAQAAHLDTSAFDKPYQSDATMSYQCGLSGHGTKEGGTDKVVLLLEWGANFKNYSTQKRDGRAAIRYNQVKDGGLYNGETFR